MPKLLLENVAIELGDKKIVPENLFVTNPSKILYVGKTGSGKTVLLKTLAGIMKDIHDARIYGTLIVEGRTQYVPQEPWPLNLGNTGYEELLITTHLYKNKAQDRLLKSLLKTNDFLKKKIKEMSYGEKRVLNILKTVITSPEILLIDEPYESLDKSNKEKVTEIIEKILNTETAIVVATSKKPLDRWKTYSIKSYSHIELLNDIDADPVIDQLGKIVIQEGAYIRRGKKQIKYPDIDLRPGEGITIIGPNGAGKTTLMLGIAGSLKIHGEHIINGNIGYVPDDVSMIFSWLRAIDVIRKLCGNNGICFDKSLRLIEELGILLNDKYFYELSDGEKRLLLLIPQIMAGKSILLIDGGLEYIDQVRAQAVEKIIDEYMSLGGIVITSLPIGDELDVLERIVFTTA